jgi:mono/diheme cytochrome c family protein
MNKWVKRTSMTLGALAILGAATVLVGKVMGERKMARTVEVAVAPVKVRSDAAHIERGRYLYSTRGCADCHGANGAGQEIFNSGGMLVRSPNITTGANSVTAGYQIEDWVRTLRHGLKPGGRPVMIMPSEDFNRLTDDDVAAVISYVKQLPAATGQPAVVQIPVMVKVLYAFGAVRDAAEIIDHSLPPSKPVEEQVTVAHGEYVANTCMSCHGAHLSGGKIPGAPVTWPAAANLTPGKGSVMTRYPTPEMFMAMLRSGHRPDGSAVSQVMPFSSLREMSETDLRALHAYLRSVPPRAAGGR